MAFDLLQFTTETGQMCSAIRGLLAIMLSLTVRKKAPQQGYLTPMTFYKSEAPTQHTLDKKTLSVGFVSLWRCWTSEM